MTRARGVFAWGLMAGIAGGLPLLSQRGATPHEQTRFSAEDEAV